MAIIVENGQRKIISLDSIDTKIVREISDENKKDANLRLIRTIKKNRRLLGAWKEHEKRCKQAKESGPIAFTEEQQTKKQEEESLTNLLPKNQDAAALKYRTNSNFSGSSSHKESHYSGSTHLGGCGCGLKFDVDKKGNVKMSTSKISAETGQHKKYQEQASSSQQIAYATNTEDGNHLVYAGPTDETKIEYQR